MVVSSEVGVLDIPPQDVEEKGRLQPGKMILVDTQEGKVIHDEEVKKQLADEFPYRTWLHENRIELDKLKSGRHIGSSVENLREKERVFGFTQEDVEKLIASYAKDAKEPTMSMGNDKPLAVM